MKITQNASQKLFVYNHNHNKNQPSKLKYHYTIYFNSHDSSIYQLKVKIKQITLIPNLIYVSFTVSFNKAFDQCVLQLFNFIYQLFSYSVIYQEPIYQYLDIQNYVSIQQLYIFQEFFRNRIQIFGIIIFILYFNLLFVTLSFILSKVSNYLK
ncbi:unnamed protein product [Paramecium pentaurelia]|uniref:Transmembrane protein n=1 Tax=Paramecium pentaurelia TaxID=43138 RepID=A0A8S1U9X0_9CILI|nr:unnamed protein product [Paramecium pentaurelia]